MIKPTYLAVKCTTGCLLRLLIEYLLVLQINLANFNKLITTDMHTNAQHRVCWCRIHHVSFCGYFDFKLRFSLLHFFVQRLVIKILNPIYIHLFIPTLFIFPLIVALRRIATSWFWLCICLFVCFLVFCLPNSITYQPIDNHIVQNIL